MKRANAYTKTQAETASKERLMVMLFQAALRHIRTGAAALESGNVRDAVGPLDRASEIVQELDATLDHSRAPELTQAISAVYEFVSLRLLAAISGQAQAAREAERAFAPLVEAFEGAVASLGQQAGSTP